MHTQVMPRSSIDRQIHRAHSDVELSWLAGITPRVHPLLPNAPVYSKYSVYIIK
jgi:hypothetical protein